MVVNVITAIAFFVGFIAVLIGSICYNSYLKKQRTSSTANVSRTGISYNDTYIKRELL